MSPLSSPLAPKARPILFQIPGTIWAIGIMSLLINISSLVIFTLSPLYLTKAFGITQLGVGLLEGTADALAWFIRPLAGFLSDFWRRRKPLLMVGAILGALSRPLLAWAPSVEWVAASRGLDRLANGLQASPREALVGDHAPKPLKGACYGLRQTLSVIGSALGALLLMYWLNHYSGDYSAIFWWTALPPICAVWIIYACVHDAPSVAQQARPSWQQHWERMKHLDPAFWFILLVSFIFMLSNYSSAFMILHAERLTHSPAMVAQLLLYQNVASMLIAFPIGRLSDRFDRRLLLGIGFCTAILANIVIGTAMDPLFLLMGATLRGLQIGITQSLLLTKVADHTVSGTRGTAFGIYYITMGLSVFLANTQMGWVAHHYGASASFFLSCVYALAALSLLPWMKSHTP